MSSEHGRDSTSRVNPPITHFPVNEVEAAISVGAGFIPDKGSWTTKAWALFLQKDVATVRRYVSQYDWPFREIGDEMYIDAEDVKRTVPLKRKSDSKPKRGGARRKKD